MCLPIIIFLFSFHLPDATNFASPCMLTSVCLCKALFGSFSVCVSGSDLFLVYYLSSILAVWAYKLLLVCLQERMEFARFRIRSWNAISGKAPYWWPLLLFRCTVSLVIWLREEYWYGKNPRDLLDNTNLPCFEEECGKENSLCFSEGRIRILDALYLPSFLYKGRFTYTSFIVTTDVSKI